MTFEQHLQSARARVEADLERRFASGSPVTKNWPDRLRWSMQHAVLGGGKRFRPFLVLESAALHGADPAAALVVASALEAVHCYSLVHDDLPAMDNDAVRRGQPTVWKAFDEWTAILAGDALLTVAFEWIAEPGSPVPPSAVGALVAALAAAAGPSGMVGGQMLDLAAGKRGEPPDPATSDVTRLQAMKTGALIRFACCAGPLLANGPASDLRAMAAFGDALGLVFQISDDILDATGDAAIMGKAVSKDAAAGKATLVALYGLDAALRVLADTQQRAREALAGYGTRAQPLLGAVDFLAARKT